MSGRPFAQTYARKEQPLRPTGRGGSMVQMEKELPARWAHYAGTEVPAWKAKEIRDAIKAQQLETEQ